MPKTKEPRFCTTQRKPVRRAAPNEDDYTYVQALLGAGRVAQRGRTFKSFTTLLLAGRSSYSRYSEEAEKYLEEWKKADCVPPLAMEFLQTNFPSVLATDEFLQRQAYVAQVYGDDSESVVSETPEHSQSMTFEEFDDLTTQVWSQIRSQDNSHMSVEEVLGSSTLDYLEKAASDSKPTAHRMTFERLLRHWAVDCNLSHKDLTKFLKLLKKYQTPLSRQQIRALPKVAKTFLRLDKSDTDNVIPQPVVFDGRVIGHYSHYGIERGLLGLSAGLVEKTRYRELLRSVLLMMPGFFPPQVVEAIRPFATTSENADLWVHVTSSSTGVVFLLHISSDGVTPFNSMASTVRCIMGSVEGVYNLTTQQTIRLPNSPPFLIGIYKGELKNADIILERVIQELEYLSPSTSVWGGQQVYCVPTAWIADAPERAAVCCTLNAAGQVSCPRCTQNGTQATSQWQVDNPGKGKNKRNFMYFPKCTDLTLRTDEAWPTYLQKLGNEPSAYRKGRCQVERVFTKMVTSFPLESQHTVDGGTSKDLLERIRGTRTRKGGYLTPEGKRIIDERVGQLRKTAIHEPARYIRTLDAFKDFKMREIHVFFLYYVYAVFSYAVGHMDRGKEILHAIKCKLLALHLTKGFSPSPVPPKDLADAKGYLQQYVEECINIFGPQWATPKNHWLLHILDDCEIHQCHLEHLSAYKYENRYGDLRRYMRHGCNALCQLGFRYCELGKYLLPLDPETLEMADFTLTPRAVAAMRELGTVELPPAFVHELRPAPRLKIGKILKCQGFRVLNTFPNNICLLSGHRVMYVIDIEEVADEEDKHAKTFFLTGFLFGKVMPAFDDPENSARIGFYKVSQLDLTRLFSVSNRDLESKCFVHTRGSYKNWPAPPVDPVPNGIADEISAYVSQPSDSGIASIQNMALDFQNSDFDEHSYQSFHCDYWWVHSLIVPGRYTNSRY